MQLELEPVIADLPQCKLHQLGAKRAGLFTEHFGSRLLSPARLSATPSPLDTPKGRGKTRPTTPSLLTWPCPALPYLAPAPYRRRTSASIDSALTLHTPLSVSVPSFHWFLNTQGSFSRLSGFCIEDARTASAPAHSCTKNQQQWSAVCTLRRKGNTTALRLAKKQKFCDKHTTRPSKLSPA